MGTSILCIQVLSGPALSKAYTEAVVPYVHIKVTPNTRRQGLVLKS